MITGVPVPSPALCGTLGAKLVCQVGSCLVCSGEMEANTSEGSRERGWCIALQGRGRDTVRRELQGWLYPRPLGISDFGILQLHFP